MVGDQRGRADHHTTFNSEPFFHDNKMDSATFAKAVQLFGRKGAVGTTGSGTRRAPVMARRALSGVPR